MENIQQAIISAAEAKPLDFKNLINSELQSKVYDALLNKKIEMAGKFFNQEEEISDEEEQTEFEFSSEENVDEDF